MRKILVLAALIMMTLLPLRAQAQEYGLLIGGGFDLKDSYDRFSFAPYISLNTPSTWGQSAHFFIPLNFSFDTGLVATSAFLIGLTPSAEYDIAIIEDSFYVLPTMGLFLGYEALDTPITNVHSFVMGIVPSVQLKYITANRFIFRFIPVSLNISPYRYSSSGVGSDGTLRMTYELSLGASYLF